MLSLSASAIAARLNSALNFITPKRLVILAALALTREIGFIAAGRSPIDGGTVSYSKPRSDFVSYYAAGSLALKGLPEDAYRRPAHYAEELRVAKHKIGYNYFYYPPIYLMLCALFALVPYIPALFSFQAASLAALLLVARATLRTRSWLVLVPLAAFPTVFWNFYTGQNAYLTAALFGGALLALRKNPIAAGILFGALCYKPHLGLLIPVALAAGQYWRAFFSATATVAALVLLSIALFGWSTWQEYFTAAAGSKIVYEGGYVYMLGFTNPFGFIRAFRGDLNFAYAAQALTIVCTALWVALIWRSKVSFAVKAATLAAAIPIAAPVSLFYELLLSAIGMAWLVSEPRNGPFPLWRKLALIFFVFAALFSGNMGKWWPMPMPFITAMGFFTIVAVYGWREMRRIRNEV